MTYTTIELAKKQVGIPLTETVIEDKLRSYLDAAEELVLGYLKSTGGTPTALDIEATYLQFAELWRFRGDDSDGDAPKSRIAGAPSVQVERCLFPRRPPTIA